MISIITEITRRKLFRYASSDGFVFGFPMNEKVKISIFTFSDLIPIMTSKWYITLTHYYDYVDDIENNFLIFLNIILVGLWNATLDVFFLTGSDLHEVWWFKETIFVTFRFLVHQKSPSFSPDSIFQSFIPDEQSLSEWLPDIFWPKAIQGPQKAESVEQEYLSQLHLSSQVTLYLLPFVRGNEYCRFSGVHLEPRIVFFCVLYKGFPI